MGRKKRKGPSLLGIFKEYFRANPDWQQRRTNEAIMEKFSKEHPAIEVTPRVKQAMFNAKNQMKRGGGGTSSKAAKVSEMRAEVAKPNRKPAGALQLLEDHVDDCLAMAKQIGREEIGDVINHLHRARNILVTKIEKE